MEQTHVFDTNFKKELLSEYKRDSKNKSQEYVKFLANKKALITIIFGQCDEATKAKITLEATYVADCQTGSLIKFLKRIRIVCFGNDDGGLSYASYKQVVEVKSMNNFSNNKPYDPYGYKEEIRIKYDSVKKRYRAILLSNKNFIVYKQDYQIKCTRLCYIITHNNGITNEL